MRLQISSLAVATALSALAPSVASAKVPIQIVPTLSGSYVVNYTEICQGYLTGSTPGSVTVESVTATFASNTVKIAGTATKGDLVIPKGLVGGTFFQNPLSETFKYSNTATQLTINGAAFNIVYGPSLKQITQSFAFSGAGNSGCAVSATGFIQ